jgi:hypothetical protein
MELPVGRLAGTSAGPEAVNRVGDRGGADQPVPRSRGKVHGALAGDRDRIGGAVLPAADPERDASGQERATVAAAWATIAGWMRGFRSSSEQKSRSFASPEIGYLACMAKTKGMDKQLFKQMRKLGVRKGHARSVAEAINSGGKAAPKAARRVSADLAGAVAQIQDRMSGGPAKRKAAAKKAARTRKRKAKKRSDSGKKAAKTRAAKS